MPKKKHPRLILSCVFVTLTAVIVFTADSMVTNILTGKIRTVIINDEDERIELRTREVIVGEILEQAKVEIGEHDYIDIDLNENIAEEVNNINIRRAVPIMVVLADRKLEFLTAADTVREAIESRGINISKLDKILDNTTENEISKYENIDGDMEIRLVKVSEEVIEEDTVLPYEVVTRENNDLNNGETQIVQEGQTGKKVTTYDAVFEDGELVSKESVKEEILSEPVNEVREIGTLLTFTTSRGSDEGYSDSLILQGTAYTAASVAGKKPGDPTYGITATGMKAKVGVVAVDRSVIPLGTKLYVESLDSSKDYGYCIAVDTGVYGNKIDLYYETINECYRFGRRNVRVYVLKDQSIDVFRAREIAAK